MKNDQSYRTKLKILKFWEFFLAKFKVIGLNWILSQLIYIQTKQGDSENWFVIKLKGKTIGNKHSANLKAHDLHKTQQFL